MDDILSGVETGSILSRHTTSSLSLLDVPSRFEKEYEPLYDVFAIHNKPLPLKVTGVKESNSDGKFVYKDGWYITIETISILWDNSSSKYNMNHKVLDFQIWYKGVFLGSSNTMP